LAHRTVRCYTGLSGATPDSPVNYSGEPFSETRSLAVGGNSPWCTGLSGAPDQGYLSVDFCSFYLNPFLDFLLVCVEPLTPVKLII
jgi:hypothetical protein